MERGREEGKRWGVGGSGRERQGRMWEDMGKRGEEGGREERGKRKERERKEK